MKTPGFFAIANSAALLAALVISSCGDLPATATRSSAGDLRGTWVSNETGVYSGSLVITYDTITIDGYGEDWLSLVGDDSKRPFRDYPKRVALKGYSEDGKLFIEYGGNTKGITYIYTEAGDYPKYKLLEFTFGDRKEIVQKTGS
jgi:hypothetical protein